ncbi:HAD family hydrolase [Streptomyces sp. ODS28]|uniref:HAD family hydrolase n=1 Tax=Streptomyces sp. ODS28 TaxID=3136688 RepID=UPI0031EE8757
MRELIGTAKCVLFDFDGPVCRLFHGRPAVEVARRLRDVVRERHGSLPVGGLDTGDPLLFLQTVFESPALLADGTAREVERVLSEEEAGAVVGAFPTEYADGLARTLAATGRQLAVATNNSQAAVERYLESRYTGQLFAGHIHGRSAEGELRLKPDPDCLLRALESTGATAQSALMIGDAPRDLAAARAAGVPFLGFARNERKAERLAAAGAEHVTSSLRDVLKIVDPGAHV